MITDLLMSIVKKWGWYLFWLCPVRENKVVVTCFKGNSYSGNPKYLVEELLRRKKPYKIYWELRKDADPGSLPPQVIPVRYESLRSLYHFATAKYWIDNARKNAYMRKRKGQYYIQTWHGGFALKKVEKDAEDTLPPYYIKSAKQDSRLADLFIADSRMSASVFRSAYWYEGEILMSGLPRNDIVIHGDRAAGERVREKLGIPPEERLILYAPTFRKDQGLQVYDIDFAACIEAARERFGGSWSMAVRLHPGMRKNAAELGVPSQRVYDLSDYPDIQELYLVSDMLVTDYSSVMFDYMYTGRPCVIFAKDIEAYKKDRGFYVELEELPFRIVRDIREFRAYISGFSEEEYRRELERFLKKYAFVRRGRAGREIADWMERQV